jgi:hypothetical protein
MIACTAVTRNYAAEAHVLAESFAEHNPGSRFVVCVIDDAGGEGLEGPFETLSPLDTGIDLAELHRQATMFAPVGLTGATKPRLIRMLAAHGEPVIYLDADSWVHASLSPVAELVERHDLVFSAHSLDPHPLVGERSAEQLFAADGPINTGLLGATAAAEPFLEWWRERTARHSVFDRWHGLFQEQGWVTAALTLFPHHLLRDRGCNVMGWNLQDRDVEWDGDTPMIDGGPLRHFHFVYGFRADDPDVLAPAQRDPTSEAAALWPGLDDRPGVARLCREYAERLLAAGWRTARAQPHRFERPLDGSPLDQWMRDRYRSALIRAESAGEAEPPNPFTHGADTFRDWVETAPPPERAGPWMRTAAAEAEAERLRSLVNEITTSASWRLTRPLRALKGRLREPGG